MAFGTAQLNICQGITLILANIFLKKPQKPTNNNKQVIEMPHFFLSNLIQGLTSSQRGFPNISHTSPTRANWCIGMHLFLTVVKGNKSKKELILYTTSIHIVQNYFLAPAVDYYALKLCLGKFRPMVNLVLHCWNPDALTQI